MEITVNIKCPDLPLAAAALAKALAGFSAPVFPAKDDLEAEAVKRVMDAAKPQIVPEPTGPAVPVQDPVSVNPTPAEPSNPAAITPGAATTAPSPMAVPTAVPTAPAPQITGDMVAKAGADLLRDNPGVYASLMALLQKYGVGCAQELRPDQIGLFATEMRALGAKI